MASRWLKPRPRGGRWATPNARWTGVNGGDGSPIVPPSETAGQPIGLLLILTKAS